MLAGIMEVTLIGGRKIVEEIEYKPNPGGNFYVRGLSFNNIYDVIALYPDAKFLWEESFLPIPA